MAIRKQRVKKTKRSMFRALDKIIRALSPIPYLARGRDFYVDSVNQCAGKASNVGVVGATGVTMALPRSFSVNSSRTDNDEDYKREVARAASQRGRTTPIRITKLSDHQPFNRSLSVSTENRHRLQQIVVERIDEESPCYFSASFKKTVAEDLQFQRSRSRS